MPYTIAVSLEMSDEPKRLIINDYRSFLRLYYSFLFSIFRARTARLRVQGTH